MVSQRSAARRISQRRSSRGRSSSLWSQLKAVIWGGVALLILILCLGGVTFWQARRAAARLPVTTTILIAPRSIESTQPVVLLNLVPHVPRAEVTTFSPDQQIMLPGGYGEYPLRSVAAFLLAEDTPSSQIRGAFSYGLERTVDHLWLVDTVPTSTNQKQLNTWFKNQLWESANEVGALPNRLQWWLWTQPLRPDQVVFEQVDDFEKWSRKQPVWLADSPLHDCPVAVINTTNISGLGSKTGRVLEKSGIAVIRITDEDQTEPNTTVIQTSEDLSDSCQFVHTKIESLLPVVADQKIESAALSRYRAPLVILIGSDMGELFTQE